MTKCAKRLNQAIEKDTLWKGRFYIKELKIASMYDFDDNSGGEIIILYLLKDKISGKQKEIYMDNYSYFYKMWIEMNNFIVDDVKVWSKI